jgi:tyrosyl-tRNA synthetase
LGPYYKLCTEVSLGVIDELIKTLAGGANPRDSKASLAREIVRIYHGDAAALKAEDDWNRTVRDKQRPNRGPNRNPQASRPHRLAGSARRSGSSFQQD